MHDLTQIAPNDIQIDALLRDRTTLDPTALAALQTSIEADGIRMPIEVWRLMEPHQTPTGPQHYGLISGLRRLTVARALALPTIPAFLRRPETVDIALANMVTENEIRAPISPWEKGALIMNSVEEGWYETPDAAIAVLYPALARQARARLRTFAMVVDALQGRFTTPERLNTTRMERLATALRAGFEDSLVETLRHHLRQPIEAQWSAILPLLQESVAPRDEAAPTTPGRPRRLLRLKQGLTIRRELTPHGWILRFSGPEAKKGGLIDDVFDLVERWLQPK